MSFRWIEISHGYIFFEMIKEPDVCHWDEQYCMGACGCGYQSPFISSVSVYSLTEVNNLLLFCSDLKERKYILCETHDYYILVPPLIVGTAMDVFLYHSVHMMSFDFLMISLDCIKRINV